MNPSNRAIRPSEGRIGTHHEEEGIGIMRAMMSHREDRWKAGTGRVDVCELEAQGIAAIYGDLEPRRLSGMAVIVLSWAVISSPVIPSPLVAPCTSFPSW